MAKGPSPPTYRGRIQSSPEGRRRGPARRISEENPTTNLRLGQRQRRKRRPGSVAECADGGTCVRQTRRRQRWVWHAAGGSTKSGRGGSAARSRVGRRRSQGNDGYRLARTDDLVLP